MIPENDANKLAHALMSILRLLDLLCAIVAALLIHALRYRHLELPSWSVPVIPGFALLAIHGFSAAGVYLFSPSQSPWTSIRLLTRSWLQSALLLAAVLLLASIDEVGLRFWLIGWVLAGLAGFIVLRLLLHPLVRRFYRQGGFVTRVVVVGAGQTGRWAIRRLNRVSRKLVQVVGIYDDRHDPDRSSIRHIEMPPLTISGDIDALMQFVRENRIDVVVVTFPYEAQERIHQLVMKLRVLPVRIHICSGPISYELDKSEVVDLGGIPMLQIVDRPLEKGGWLVKAVEDILVASLALVLTAPLLLLIAVAIKLESPGPVLFVQARGGFNGRTFRMYKFRSMRHDPQARLLQAGPGDARVTRVGRILRRYSLDELPQFLNVLKGDMSVVGPRPHALEHDQEFSAIIGQYVARLRVKPGLTGWAQINGFRGLTDTREKLLKRLEYDLYYIDHWSLRLDLWIILRTIFASAAAQNAY